MLNDQSLLCLAEDTTYQSMGPGEDTVVLSLSSGYLYTCNETTRAFLEVLDGRRQFGQVVEQLAGRYDVPPDKLRADLSAMAERLLAEGIIVERPAEG